MELNGKEISNVQFIVHFRFLKRINAYTERMQFDVIQNKETLLTFMQVNNQIRLSKYVCWVK